MNKTGDRWWIGIFLIRLTYHGHLKWSKACCRHKSQYLIPSCIKLPRRMWAGQQDETRKKEGKNGGSSNTSVLIKKTILWNWKKTNGSNQICKYESGLYKYRGKDRREKRINTWWMKEYSVLQHYKLDDKIHILYVTVVKRLCIKTELKHDRNWV